MRRVKKSAKPKDFEEPKKSAKGKTIAEDVKEEKFRWTTYTCDFEGPFGWSHVDLKELHLDIIPKLQNFETQTWSELETQSGGHHHFSKVSDFSEAARKRLDEIVEHKEGIYAELFSLRLQGSVRIWGVKERAKLQILWYDPDHQVYPVEKDQGDKEKFNRRKAQSNKDRNRNK